MLKCFVYKIIKTTFTLSFEKSRLARRKTLADFLEQKALHPFYNKGLKSFREYKNFQLMEKPKEEKPDNTPNDAPESGLDICIDVGLIRKLLKLGRDTGSAKFAELMEYCGNGPDYIPNLYDLAAFLKWKPSQVTIAMYSNRRKQLDDALEDVKEEWRQTMKDDYLKELTIIPLKDENIVIPLTKQEDEEFINDYAVTPAGQIIYVKAEHDKEQAKAKAKQKRIARLNKDKKAPKKPK